MPPSLPVIVSCYYDDTTNFRYALVDESSETGPAVGNTSTNYTATNGCKRCTQGRYLGYRLLHCADRDAR